MIAKLRALRILVQAGVTVLAATCATSGMAADSFVAVLNEQNNNSDSRRSVMFYDANDIGGAPLFSVFMPFEFGTGNFYEDPSSITVNPATGDIYIFAFDNAAPQPANEWAVDPGPDGVVGGTDDDTSGDWDLYRINFQTVLNHWKTTYMGFDARTVVGPSAVDPDSPLPTTKAGATAAELMDYVSYGVVTPYAAAAETNLAHLSVDGGVHDQTHSNQVTLGNVNVPGGAIEKIGEVNRNRYLGGSNFHVPLVSFIDPSTLFMVDDARQPKNVAHVAANDYDYRIIERASTSPGAATVPGTSTGVDGGFNNTTTESWNSRRIAQMNLDADETGADPSLLSDPQSSAFYSNGTLRGVWVADRDRTVAGGSAYPKPDGNDADDIAFLQLDGSGNSLGYRSFTASANPVAGDLKFEMDNDPAAANDNLGRAGKLFVDSDTGDLIVVEEGFQFDSPTTEPAVIRVPVNYDVGGKIELGAWGTKQFLTPTKDTADTFNERGYFSAYDSASDKMYFVSPGENDADPLIANGVDIYVLDLTSGLTTSFMNVDDSYSLFFGNNNMDAGDKIAAFTLPAAGVAGDYNDNGTVDAADYVAWRNAAATDTLPNDPTPGTVDASDYTTWQANFGKTQPGSGSSLAVVPEPAGVGLLLVGLVGMCFGRHRSGRK